MQGYKNLLKNILKNYIFWLKGLGLGYGVTSLSTIFQFYYIVINIFLLISMENDRAIYLLSVACKYNDKLHDYFSLKLIGKYLLLYNKTEIL